MVSWANNCGTLVTKGNDDLSYDGCDYIKNFSSGPIDSIGDVFVHDCSKIHIGTNNVYNGNLTIKQYNHPLGLPYENKVEESDDTCIVIHKVKELKVVEGVVSCEKNEPRTCQGQCGKGKWCQRLLSWKTLVIILVFITVAGALATTIVFCVRLSNAKQVYFSSENNEPLYNNRFC